MFDSRLHVSKPLLGALLGFFRDIGVVESSLETTGNVVGVLVSAVGGHGLRVTAVLNLLEDLLGVLLGLIGGVWGMSVRARRRCRGKTDWGCLGWPCGLR